MSSDKVLSKECIEKRYARNDKTRCVYRCDYLIIRDSEALIGLAGNAQKGMDVRKIR